MKKRIVVTKKRIEAGEEGNCKRCPVALAIKAQWNGTGIQVISRQVGFPSSEFGEDTRWVDLPPSAIHFIKKFDRGLAVKPFSFDLEVPV